LGHGNERKRDEGVKSAAIIYGRANSRRFPQKCFAPIGQDGHPLAHWVVRRAAGLNVDLVVFATTNNSCDDELAESFQDLNLPEFCIFRGHEVNLVQRTLDCLMQMNIDVFARINGDSPFFPVEEINRAFALLKSDSNCRFVSNLTDRTFPYGVAVEVMDASLYINYASLATSSELEHTTLHLYRIASDQITPLLNDVDQQSVSLTIDTEQDWKSLNGNVVSRDLHFASDWREML